MLRTVHLHGRLGKKFGKKYELDVGSAAEALRALFFQIPGFADYFRHRQYSVTVGAGTSLDMESLDLQLGQQRDIHITPAGATSGIETILLVGILVFSAVAAVSVLSMPKAPSANSREEATKTSSFIFDGATNVTEQGHVVPLIYGQFRVGSVVASSGISTSDANQGSVGNNPTNPTYGGVLGGFGVPGAYGGHIGTLPGMGGSPAGREWIELLKGGKGGAGTTRSAQEDPNSLQSQATAKVLDVIGEGEIVGLVDGLKSVYFDETPLQNADDTFNFAGVSVEQRVGLPDQDFIPGFTQAENSREINTEVTTTLGPVTRSIVDQTVTVARITIRLPQLYKQDTTNGDLKATTVAVKISVQADGGGFSDVATMTFTGKTNSGYQRSMDIRLPNGVNRDIRVTRITADSAVASVSNETFWDLLTEVVEAKLSYPDTAMIGLTVDARQFGSSIPTRSYDVKGLIIEVPSNYNPVTRVYTGIWDGTFIRAWTDNPAWVLRDIALSKRYGLGNRVADNAPDKWALYEIAKYNDELVPDGFGGTQPRYTINCVINNPAQAYEVMNSIASNCRAVTYWGSGSIMTTQDRPEDPSFLITPSNIVGGTPSYSRITPVERRRSVAVVYWNDPEDGYRLTPEVYEDPELIRRFGRRGDSTDDAVSAFGITNRGQAHRFCRWILEDESPSSNSVVNYQAGDDHGFLEPGRVGVLEDPMFTAARRGGRVRTALANSVEVDSAVTLIGGQAYTLRVMLPDGTTRSRAVTNAAGVHTVLNLSGAAFGTPPAAGAVWALESNVVANRQWRIRQMTTDEPPYEVTAILHDPTKYARVEEDRDIEVPNFLGLPTGPLQPPTQIDVIEFLFEDGTAAVPSVQVSWDASPDPRVTFYQAQYKTPTGNWEAFADDIEVGRVVRGVQPGLWSFRVRALDSLGRKTRWVEYQIVLDGEIDALPSVSGLSVLVDPAALQPMLIWVNPTDRRPLRYEVLYDDAGVFANAISLATLDTQEYVISQTGTYWVRSVFLNAVQAAPPSIVIDTGDLPDFAGVLNIGDDSTLTPVEKQFAIRESADYGEQLTEATTRATALGITTELTAATTAQGTLAAYLAGLVPAWTDTTTSTTIVRATWRTRWAAVFDTLAALQRRVSEEDAKRSIWNLTAGRPPLLTGPSLTVDETFKDPSVWSYSPGLLFLTDAAGEGYIEQNGSTVVSITHQVANAIPVDFDATYEAQWELNQTGAGAGTSVCYTVVQLFDAAGANITGDGTYWYYPTPGIPVTTRGIWEPHAARFGKGTDRPFPSNAAKMSVGLILNYSNLAVVTKARRSAFRRITTLTMQSNVPRYWALGDGKAIRPGGTQSNWGISVAFGLATITGPQRVSWRWSGPDVVGDKFCGLTEAAAPTIYNNLKMGIYYSGTAGRVGIWVDGVEVIAYTGITTRNADEFAVEYDGMYLYPLRNGARMGTYQLRVGPGKTYRTLVDSYYVGQGVIQLDHKTMNSLTVIGSNTVDINGNPVPLDALRNNMIDVGWWKKGATIPWSATTGPGAARSMVTTPSDINVAGLKGNPEDAMHVTKTGASGANPGGGWDPSAASEVPGLDPDKTYRFMLPVRFISGDCSHYFGINGGVCAINTTTPVGNPYFAASGPGSLSADRWYVFVGFIYPRNSTGKAHDSAGVYDCRTGKKIAAGVTGENYCFPPVNGPVQHRAFQYYGSVDSSTLFGKPIVNVVDGTEPELSTLFEVTSSLEDVSLDWTTTFKHIVQGNSVSKTLGAAAAWDGKAITQQSYRSNAFISGRLETSNTFIGLHELGGSPVSYTSMEHSVHRSGDGNWYYWSGAAAVLNMGTSRNGVTFGDLTDWAIFYDNATLKIFADGVDMTVTATVVPDRTYQGGAVVFGSTHRVSNIRFGPFTENTIVTALPPPDVTINADYLGAIIGGQFNKVMTPTVKRGGSDFRTNDRMTYTATNITGGLVGYVTMNNILGSADKGRATATNCTSPGTYMHNIFYDGVLLNSFIVKFGVVPADPPVGGGGGGGTKSGTFPVSTANLTTTTLVEMGRITGLVKAAGETIRCSLATAVYEHVSTLFTTRAIAAKFQYSVTGAESWTDVGGIVTGTQSTWDDEAFYSEAGSITISQNVAPSNNTYDVRLVASEDITGPGSTAFNIGHNASVIIGV